MKTNPTITALLMDVVRREFDVPSEINLTAGSGEICIIASSALIAPHLCIQMQQLLDGAKEEAQAFSRKPQGGISLSGSSIAERALLDRVSFMSNWEANGIFKAVADGTINPIFSVHIHQIVRVAIDYCQFYGLTCNKPADKRHFEHLKPLRYILHA